MEIHDAISKMDLLLSVLFCTSFPTLSKYGGDALVDTRGEHQICVPFALTW